jgi:hypothetical protein
VQLVLLPVVNPACRSSRLNVGSFAKALKPSPASAKASKGSSQLIFGGGLNLRMTSLLAVWIVLKVPIFEDFAGSKCLTDRILRWPFIVSRLPLFAQVLDGRNVSNPSFPSQHK